MSAPRICRAFAGCIATLVAVGTVSNAFANCAVPNSLTNGQVADASEVMGNFDAVAACADAAASAAVTPTGTPATGNIAVFSGAKTVTGGNLSGDVSTSGGTTTTLSSTGVTAGSYASANITVDAKGRVISASDGAGAGANRFAQVRLFTGTGLTNFDVDSTSNVRIVPFSFATDFTYFPWTHYQIVVSGEATQSGQSLVVELHSAGGTYPSASSGNDLTVPFGVNLHRSSWIARTDGKTGPQEYTLLVKGSNNSVDLRTFFIEVLLSIQ